MAENTLAQKRNQGSEPVKAEPNQDREKTYEPSNPPSRVTAETEKLPEKVAEGKVETDVTQGVEAVKKQAAPPR